jgi:Pyruvate/2-oxoacid:ferredoxin oxidoreductase gamma subunit
VEREIMLTGMGGQGVQLGAQVLATAATHEGLHVMYLGTYGGTMRGGNTDSTMVIGDAPISAPPIVARIGAALVMHHAFWPPVRAKLRPGADVIVNSSVFEGNLSGLDAKVCQIAATELATQLGNPLCASMVLIAAYASRCGVVTLDSLLEAMRQSIPSYRTQHIELNELALRTGFSRGADSQAESSLPEGAVG